jgi:hypothetical protein
LLWKSKSGRAKNNYGKFAQVFIRSTALPTLVYNGGDMLRFNAAVNLKYETKFLKFLGGKK